MRNRGGKPPSEGVGLVSEPPLESPFNSRTCLMK